MNQRRNEKTQLIATSVTSTGVFNNYYLQLQLCHCRQSTMTQVRIQKRHLQQKCGGGNSSIPGNHRRRKSSFLGLETTFDPYHFARVTQNDHRRYFLIACVLLARITFDFSTHFIANPHELNVAIFQRVEKKHKTPRRKTVGNHWLQFAETAHMQDNKSILGIDTSLKLHLSIRTNPQKIHKIKCTVR